MEEWKEVFDRPDYLVSNMGHVMSKKNMRILKGSKAGEGYRKIVFTSGKHKYIHHMVLESFVGQREIGQQARHLNGNKADNRLINLAWGTPQENATDKKHHGTNPARERNPMSKLDMGTVLKMRADRKELGISFKKIGVKYGVSTITAYRAVEGVTWK